MSADKMHVCWLLVLVLAVRVSSFKQTKGPLVFRQSKIVQKPSLEESSFRTAMVEGSATVVVASGDVTPRPSLWGKILATWGVVGVLSVIGNAVRRLVPVALEPVKNGDLTPFHWSVYIGWTAFMTYTEGYSAFQKKFSPLVVKRAFTLQENPGFFNYLLAGPYSMGLFNATPKRLKVSWIVSSMVFGIVQVVKRLPYPWRGIADAGVVAGLTYGSASILFIFLRALFGSHPTCSAELPEKVKKE